MNGRILFHWQETLRPTILLAQKCFQRIKIGEQFRGAANDPATHLLNWNVADHVHRNAMPERQGQFPVRARSLKHISSPWVPAPRSTYSSHRHTM